MDLLLNTRFPRWNALADLMNFSILVLWTGAMTYEAWYLFIDAWEFNEVDDSALRHPMWPVNLALLVGVACIAVQGMVGILRSLVLLVFPDAHIKPVTIKLGGAS
mgnify:FL=1